MLKRIVAVTGATGFVGSKLCEHLELAGYEVRRLSRSSSFREGFVQISNIGPQTDWSLALKGVSVIVHCAARVHTLDDQSVNRSTEYMSVNCFGTQHLAIQAAASNVKRLIFLSSIKVNGEVTGLLDENHKFTHLDIPRPVDDYAVSKWMAEQALWDVSTKTGMEVVVIRAPLVYGPNVQGNFLRLMKIIKKGIPLPLMSIKNKRSFIGVDNLSDLLSCCIEHPMAGGRTFLASDGHDISTPELIRLLSNLMGVPCRLFPVPEKILNLCGHIFERNIDLDRLIKSLVIDMSYTSEILGWKPVISIQDGLLKASQGLTR